MTKLIKGCLQRDQINNKDAFSVIRLLNSKTNVKNTLKRQQVARKITEEFRFKDEVGMIVTASTVESALKDRRLRGGAYKLLEHLSSSSAQNKKRGAVRIKNNVLASFFGVSERTIQRWLKMLRSGGYIVSQQNYVCYSQVESTHHIKKPSAGALIDPWVNKTFTKEDLVQIVSRGDTNVMRIEDMDLNNKNNIDRTVTGSKETEKVGFSFGKKLEFSCGLLKTQVTTLAKPTFSEKMPRDGLHEKSQISSEATVRIKKLEGLERKIRKKILVQDKKLILNLNDQQRGRLILKKIGILETKKAQVTTALQEIKKEVFSQNENDLFLRKITNIQYFNNAKGERTLTSDEYNRLVSSLQGMGYCGKALAEKTNEVIFSIRFGALQKKQGSDEELSKHHAISISLKLLREMRWERPVGMKKYSLMM